MSKKHLYFSPKFQQYFLHPKYWLTWSGVAFIFCIGLLPCSIRRKVACKLARPIMRFAKKPINIARTNIKTCFPDLSEQNVNELIRKNTISFLTEIFSQTRLLMSCNVKLLSDVNLTGSKYIQQNIKAEKPIIFVLPHVWGIDYAGLRLNAEIPMVSMAKPHKNPIYNWLAAKIRTSNGGKIYKREAGLRSIISELKKNKSFLYLPDEDLGAKHSVFAPFFSTPKATLPVVARLARASNATVIPISLCYCDQSHQYKLNLLPPLELCDLACKEDEAQLLNQVVEKIIRVSPEQYMWFLRIFKTRPDGKKGFYKQALKKTEDHLID